MKFPDTKRSRGFGFVTYSKDEEVDACQSHRPHTIDGKTVETKRATPREEFGKPEAGQTVKKVFVGGLKEEMTEDDIRQYFETFGKITSVTRLTEKDTGKPRGFGFVEFDDYDPVDKCILKGSHQINGKRVDVKKAVSKQEMNSMGGGGQGGMRGGRGGGRGGWNGPPGRNQYQGNQGNSGSGVAEEAVVEAGMDRLGEISIRAIKETVATGEEEAISGLKVEIGEIMVAMAATTEEVGTIILKEGGEIRAMAEAMVGTDQATMAIWATTTEDGVAPVEAMAEVMAAMEEDRLWMPEDMIKASAVDLCAKIQVVIVET